MFHIALSQLIISATISMLPQNISKVKVYKNNNYYMY